MGFTKILGQQRVVRLLRQAVLQENLPHAFLFTGMEGVGKTLTAFTFAKAVNCTGGVEADCCNRCLSCRKVNNCNHPDVFTLEREGPFIKIDQIRALQQRLRFRPLEGDYRVMVIVDAQNLKVEAANALLKILEEPPPANIFILTAFPNVEIARKLLAAKKNIAKPVLLTSTAEEASGAAYEFLIDNGIPVYSSPWSMLLSALTWT